ncbi:MAG: hypothetical protein ACKPE1_20390 [Dolichospermum sp.]
MTREQGTLNWEQGTLNWEQVLGKFTFRYLCRFFSAHLLRKYCSQPYPLPLWGTGVSKPLP